MNTENHGVAEPTDAEQNLGPRAVHRALEVLTVVIEQGPLSLLAIATACGLPSSTAMRSLRALEHWNYVFRLDDNSYVAGARFVSSQIQVEAPDAGDLVEKSAPILQRIAELTGESSYLAIPGPAGTCVYLREVQSNQAVRFVGFDGWTGKAVARANSAVGDALDGFTPQQGFVMKEAALTPEANVIAAPVADRAGAIVASLSVAGPSFRLTGARAKKAGAVVRDSANELSSLLP